MNSKIHVNDCFSFYFNDVLFLLSIIAQFSGFNNNPIVRPDSLWFPFHWIALKFTICDQMCIGVDPVYPVIV